MRAPAAGPLAIAYFFELLRVCRAQHVGPRVPEEMAGDPAPPEPPATPLPAAEE